MKNANETLKQLDIVQLGQEIERLRRELFTSKLAAITAPPKDISQQRKLRKDLARALTFVRQKRV